MNFLSATDAPVIWPWGEAHIALPPWTIDDLKTLLARLQEQKLAHLQQACAEMELSAMERAYVLARARWQPLSPADAAAYFHTVEGVQEALRHALAKAAVSPAQITAMLAATPFSTLFDLAQDVVRLRLRDSRGPTHDIPARRDAEHAGPSPDPFAFPPGAD